MRRAAGFGTPFFAWELCHVCHSCHPYAESCRGPAGLGHPRLRGHVAWRRAQVDTRLKLLACWNPKKYGQKQQVDVGNKEGVFAKLDPAKYLGEIKGIIERKVAMSERSQAFCSTMKLSLAALTKATESNSAGMPQVCCPDKAEPMTAPCRAAPGS